SLNNPQSNEEKLRRKCISCRVLYNKCDTLRMNLRTECSVVGRDALGPVRPTTAHPASSKPTAVVTRGAVRPHEPLVHADRATTPDERWRAVLPLRVAHVQARTSVQRTHAPIAARTASSVFAASYRWL